MRTRVLALAVTGMAVVGLSGCDVSRMQFRNDHRLTFQSPEARAVVATPVTLSWQMKGFDAVGLDGSTDKDRGAFVVFLDRAPMSVGKDLRSLASGDTACARDARCPDATYLARHGVYVTTDSSLALEQLPATAANSVDDEQHYVNVVLVDGTGRRTGESAWYLPFQSKRRSA